MGAAAAAAGDFNGDAFPDLILGNRPVGRLGETSNTCYLVFGAPNVRVNPLLDLTSPSERSLAIVAGGLLGFGHYVSGGVDWDGDGAADVVLGSAEGRVDVLFGTLLKEVPFLRGDANQDGITDISDAIFTLGFLFLGNELGRCLDAMDVDDKGTLEITDAILLLEFLFLSGKPPAAPFPEPGDDPTPDGIGCKA